MKKTKLVLFSVLSTLIMTGCGSNDTNKDKTNEDQKDNNSTQILDSKNFKLFNPTETSQLSEKCKKYVDDMRKQEQENAQANGEDSKYMMDGYAFHPKDEVKINAEDANHKKIYRDDIDFDDATKWEEQSAQKSDRSKGVKLKFECENGFSANSYKIQLATDNAFTKDLISVDANPNSEICVKNLFQNTDYYWRVVTDKEISSISTFKTGDYPRWIDCDTMFNVRDNGGYMTSSGKRVKQGLIFRGGEICLDAFDVPNGMSQTKHQISYSEKAKDIFRNTMKIGNELDLRNENDLRNTKTTNAPQYNGCAFAEKGEDNKDDIKWTQVSLSSWENILNNKQNLQKCFEAFAHADEAPVYYHCHGGADRTGTLGLFVLGVLGVSYSDIVIDYELTSYSSIIAGSIGGEADSLRQHDKNGTYNRWNQYVPNNLEKTTGWDKTKTLQENCYNYLVNVAEIPQETMDRFINIMLED